MSIISALPFNLTNGSVADATQVMADFNQIVNNVNTNALANSGGTLTLTSITNSSIDSSPIGGSAPSTGVFTNLTANGTLGVVGATTLASLGVSGATTLASLGVSGATTLASLGVSGVGTFSGGLTLSGSLLKFATPVSVASATTVDLGAQLSNIIDITGTVTISSFGSTAVVGQEFDVRFTGALTLTYNATSLILPSLANITTAANDTARVRALGSGNFIVINYQKANGLAVSSPLPYFAKATFTSMSSVNPTINGNTNIASITRASTGVYSVLFTNAAPNINYSISAMAALSTNPDMVVTLGNVTPSTTGFSFRTYTTGSGLLDPDTVNIVVFT